MVKALRKYQKWVLVIGGTLLMLAWLLPTAITQWGQSVAAPTLATISGKNVKPKDFEPSRLAYTLVKNIMVPSETLRAGLKQEEMFARMSGAESAWHWYLLDREARAAGLVGAAGDGAAWRQKVLDSSVEAEIMRSGARDTEELASLRSLATQFFEMREGREAGNMRLSEREVNEAWASFAGIMRLRMQYGSIAQLSDARARKDITDRNAAATVKIAEVSARALASTMPAPSEEELAAHFETYKAVDPAEAKNGIGYVLPNRVRVKWFAFSREKIGAAITLDAVDVAKHYTQNRETFKGELGAERANVEKALRDRKVEEVVSELTRVYSSSLTTQMRGVERRGGVYVLGDDWASKESMLGTLAGQMIEAVKTRTGVTLEVPGVEGRDTWLTQAEVQSLPGIGFSAIQAGQSRIPFNAFVMGVRELDAASLTGVQAGVPSPVWSEGLVTSEIYFFEVTGAREKGPAGDLSEVREQAIKDFNALKAYETISSRQGAALAEACLHGIDAGVDALMSGFTAEKPNVRDTRVAGENRRGFSVETTDEFVDASLSIMRLLDPRVASTDENQAQRTLVVPLPERLVVAVARLESLEPVTVEALRGSRGASWISGAIGAEFESAIDKTSMPLDFETLSKRYDFSIVEREDRR
ncbi:MAG: hypothetical protein IPK69_10130 [Phycisphaerales bacterium]|nr:MAG: hypothetical protein IPK69_10130 [Phycisphaerales bacterium]